jgi:hypothetical protein
MSRNWTWDEIYSDWLSGNRLGLPPEELVTAFNRAEQVLGRQWIETTGSNRPGTYPALHVASADQRLSSLDGASGTEELIRKLQASDASAFAELTAVHLLRSQNPNSDVELGHVVQIGWKSVL